MAAATYMCAAPHGAVSAGAMPSALSAPAWSMRPEELAFASEQALGQALEQRERELGRLLEEIESLERAPAHLEERLEQLERYFSDLRPGDTLQLYSPALHTAGRFLEEERARASPNGWMQRCDLLAAHHDHHRRMGSDAPYTGFEAVQPQSGDMVLAKDCMLLDRVSLHHVNAHAERRQGFHPTIEKVHYAGHVGRPDEEVHHVFVTPGGGVEKRPLRPLSHDPGTFWLHRRHRLEQHVPAQQEPPPGAGPPQSHVAAQDRAAVDWLGLARRGEPVPEDLQGPGGDPVDWLPPD